MEPHSLGNFHIKDRKRDRNAQTTIQHIVQKRIARIVVVLAVAAKSWPRRTTRDLDAARCSARGGRRHRPPPAEPQLRPGWRIPRFQGWDIRFARSPARRESGQSFRLRYREKQRPRMSPPVPRGPCNAYQMLPTMIGQEIGPDVPRDGTFGLRPQHVAGNEEYVGRALAQTPHEVWIPLRAERDVHAHPPAISHQALLQIAPDAV